MLRLCVSISITKGRGLSVCGVCSFTLTVLLGVSNGSSTVPRGRRQNHFSTSGRLTIHEFAPSNPPPPVLEDPHELFWCIWKVGKKSYVLGILNEVIWDFFFFLRDSKINHLTTNLTQQNSDSNWLWFFVLCEKFPYAAWLFCKVIVWLSLSEEKCCGCIPKKGSTIFEEHNAEK